MLMEMFATLLSRATTTLDIEVNMKCPKEMLCFLSPSMICTVPSLLLNNFAEKNSTSISKSTRSLSLLSTNIAQNLATPLRYTKQEIFNAPEIILNNFTDSFMHLVDSRMRNIKQVVLCSKAKASLLRILSNTSLVKARTVVTSFRILSSDENYIEINQIISLPILFEATIDLDILDGEGDISHSFSVPGTMTGSFLNLPSEIGIGHPSMQVIQRVEVNLETSLLLQLMIHQAISVAKKTFQVALATSCTLDHKKCTTSNATYFEPIIAEDVANANSIKDSLEIQIDTILESTKSQKRNIQDRTSPSLTQNIAVESKDEEYCETINYEKKYSQDALEAANGLTLLHKDNSIDNSNNALI